MIWKIAWGSVRRHGRRSLLIILAIALSVAVMEFVVGMMSGMRKDFFETMVSSGGHLQVEHPDAEDALDPTSLELLIPEWAQYRDWFADQPEVLRAEPLLTFGALLVNEGTNAPMIGYGVRPDTGYFSDVRGGIEEGRFLSGDQLAPAPAAGDTTDDTTGDTAPAEPREILISTETATMLDLTLGDPAMILVEDSTGAPYYLDYTVVGTFRSDSGEFDESSFLISHTAAQDLLYVGEETREIRVALTDETLAPQVAERFAAAFPGTTGGTAGPRGAHSRAPRGAGQGGAPGSAAPGAAAPTDSETAAQPGSSAPQNASSGASGADTPNTADARTSAPAPVTIRTWREIQGGTAVLLEMFDIFMYAINILIVIVAATVITNAILMNVFEKMREYGMMRAIGLTNRGVFRPRHRRGNRLRRRRQPPRTRRRYPAGPLLPDPRHRLRRSDGIVRPRTRNHHRLQPRHLRGQRPLRRVHGDSRQPLRRPRLPRRTIIESIRGTA